MSAQSFILGHKVFLIVINLHFNMQVLAKGYFFASNTPKVFG